jgi:hypothetical protein
MAAKFEISKDHAGKFRFHLKAPNGEIIATEEQETEAISEKRSRALWLGPVMALLAAAIAAVAGRGWVITWWTI